MRIASAISAGSDSAALAADIAEQLQPQLFGAPVDAMLIFITAPLHAKFQDILLRIRDRVPAKTLLACLAESVLGVDREIEKAPAVSVLAMSMPGVTVESFHISDEEWPELLGNKKTLHSRLETSSDLRLFVVLGDPFTTPVVQLLDAFGREFPSAPIVGGMSSGMEQPGQTRLAVNDDVFSSGMAGISISGPVQVDCVVSQGCRPIGRTFVITRGRENIIEELDGSPALDAIQRMINDLGPAERAMVEKKGLQIGRVIDERKGNFGRGDFLVRNILGIDRAQGVLAIGDMVRADQTVQFQVQDAGSAEEDLRLLLEGELLLANAPSGVLMFTCNGRGTHLFASPNHDINIVRSVLGPVPVAGFFCAGELGPVGGRSFIHGQTVSLALFR